MMQTMSARDAKNQFGKLIDIARAEPVAIEKHGRAVVVVLSIEAYERLQSIGTSPARIQSTGHRDGTLSRKQTGAGVSAKLAGEA